MVDGSAQHSFMGDGLCDKQHGNGLLGIATLMGDGLSGGRLGDDLLGIATDNSAIVDG